MYKNKILLFILLLIPYILHGYAENISLLYWNEVIILAILILIIYLNKGAVIVFDLEAKLYLFFIFSISLPVIIFQVDYIRDIIKYTSYILIYLLVFRNYLNKKKYYEIFINFMLFYLLVSFPIYFIDVVLKGDFYSHFPIQGMLLPDTLKIVSRTNYTYYFPYYLYLVPKLFITSELNLFGFYRFFGFSYEPTTLSIVLLPLVFISIDLKKYKSAILFSIFIFIVSSYAAIVLWILFILIYFSLHIKHFKYFAILIIVYTLYTNFNVIYDSLLIVKPLQNRLVSYTSKLYVTVKYHIVASVNVADNPYVSSTASIISNTLRYGIINLVSFLAIFGFYLKKIINLNNYNIIIIFLVVILYSQKAPYYFTPLIFFYINYINIYFKSEKDLV